MTVDLVFHAFNRRILAAGRTLAGLSQAELAEAAGIHLNALQRIEAGGNMHPSTFMKLFRALEALGIEPVRGEDGVFSGVRFMGNVGRAKPDNP